MNNEFGTKIHTMVDIVQEFFPDGTVRSQWLPDHILDIEVELGLRAALGAWGPRIDGARVMVALEVADYNKHHGATAASWDAQVTLRFTKPATAALAAGHGAIGLLERFLS